MKKRIAMSALCAVVVGTAGYVGYNSMPKDVGSDLLLANVEALARGENDGNTVDCYSESDAKKGSTYYDCGDCTLVHNSKGKGSKRTCVKKKS